MKEHTHVLLGQLCLYTKYWNQLSNKKRYFLSLFVPIFAVIFTYMTLMLTIDWQQKLFEAARDGNLIKAKWAIFFRAKTNHIASFDNRTWSPVSHAIANCHPDMVRLFAKKGASMNYFFGKTDEQWHHSSARAILTDHPETIKAFTEAGGQLDNCTPEGKNAITFAIVNDKRNAVSALQDYMDFNEPDKAGVFPLTYALEIEDSIAREEWSNHLLTLGADPASVDASGNSTLHQLLMRADRGTRVVALTAGVIWLASRTKGSINMKNKKGMTPLTFAAKHGNGKAMDALTGKGAKLTMKNKAGKTVFDILDEKGHNKLFQKHAKQLKQKNPKAFQQMQRRFPHRIGPKGKILKRPLPKPSVKKYKGRRYRARRGVTGKRLLRRFGIGGLILSFLL